MLNGYIFLSEFGDFVFLVAFKLQKMFEESVAIKVISQSSLILIHSNILYANSELVLSSGKRVGKFEIIDDEFLQLFVLNY